MRGRPRCSFLETASEMSLVSRFPCQERPNVLLLRLSAARVARHIERVFPRPRGVGASSWRGRLIRLTVERNRKRAARKATERFAGHTGASLLASSFPSLAMMRHRPALRVISSAYSTKRWKACTTAARSSRRLSCSHLSSTIELDHEAHLPLPASLAKSPHALSAGRGRL
jgi:hypothetical protein